MQTHRFSILDMHCASCVKSITDAINTVPGVMEVTVNFASRSAVVHGTMSVEAVIQAVKAAGYSAERDVSADEIKHETEVLYRFRLKQAMAAAIVGIPLFSDVFIHWIPTVDVPERQWFWFIIAAIVSAVMWFSGRQIYRGLWQSILKLKGNMDTLVGMGTGVAWLYSLVVVCIPGHLPSMARHVYFDTTALLLAFITFGNALEIRARGNTSQALQKLIALAPKTARVIRDGIEQDLPIEQIQLGDMLRLLPGETVAVDGIVIEGESQLNESMLTGEPLPVHKRLTDNVFAGTVNQSGSVLYKATRIGNDTALQRVISLVEKAQDAKPAVSRMVDTVASIFVPCVLVVVLLTIVGWAIWGPDPKTGYVLTTAIAVLVIACPCALGLATPMAVMVGVGKAAQSGILIRNGEALQTAAQLDIVVLDKTGTITEGNPAVTDVLTHDIQKAELISYVAAIEKKSEHPLAKAIVDYAKSDNTVKADEFKALPGYGVSARINNQTVLVGNVRLMQNAAITSASFDRDYQRLVAEGKTVLLVAVDQQIKGLIAIADTIKSDSKQAIQKLQAQGLKVVMLTGDNQQAASYTAKQVNIDHVIAEVLPEDKVAEVEKLQAQNQKVAMVGDGINDAAALTQAHLGIAMGGGADVAIEAADMALMVSSLSHVVDAIYVSQRTMRNIKQNLFGAFIYNVIGVPIAAGVLYPWLHLLLNPLIAGAAMALSSVTVVLNANRLRFL